MYPQQGITGNEFAIGTNINENQAGVTEGLRDQFTEVLRSVAQHIPAQSYYFDNVRARLMEAWGWAQQGIAQKDLTAHS